VSRFWLIITTSTGTTSTSTLWLFQLSFRSSSSGSGTILSYPYALRPSSWKPTTTSLRCRLKAFLFHSSSKEKVINSTLATWIVYAKLCFSWSRSISSALTLQCCFQTCGFLILWIVHQVAQWPSLLAYACTFSCSIASLQPIRRRSSLWNSGRCRAGSLLQYGYASFRLISAKSNSSAGWLDWLSTAALLQDTSSPSSYASSLPLLTLLML